MSNNTIPFIDQLIQASEYEKAETACIELLDENDNNAAAFSKLGEIYLQQGKDTEAQIFFEKAVKLGGQIYIAKNERNGWSAIKRKNLLVDNIDINNELIKSVYVNQEIEVFYGEKATDLLSKNNDKKYLTDKGIIKVDKKRWLTAQKYEKKTWMERSLRDHDDRNYEHKERFNNYDSLKSYKFEKVIELGCGPFTNLRIILEDIKSIKSITLLDPLISEYLKHPNCVYKNSTLLGIPVRIINSPVEEFVSSEKYDLVVMNNVLEHCYDIPTIFKVLVSLLNEGGIFVFADVAFSSEVVKIISEKQYDAGHPIRLEENYLIDFLAKHFQPIYEKKFQGLYDQPNRKDFYFIGEYKNASDVIDQPAAFSVKNEKPVIHFVYSGDPQNDTAISAPGTITNKLYRYFEKHYPVKYYNLDDVSTPINVGESDIIIGHPHPDKNTAIKRLFSQPSAGKYLLWPFHTRIPEINRFVKEVEEKADKLFIISGPYWLDTIEKTEYRSLKNKIIRLDNAIDSNIFPMLKNNFNPVGERGLFVLGRSGTEKGTKELFKLLMKINCPLIVAGNYNEEDISFLNKRPKTKYIGAISFSNKTVVNDIIDKCDFFINLSISDASPTTLLETMSLGLIPITTPQCGYYYSSTILLSLLDEELNIITINNALTMDEVQLKILQIKNRNIIEKYHTWDVLCGKIGEKIFPRLYSKELSTTKRKRIKVAEEHEVGKSLTQIDSVSVFAKEIKKIITEIRPSKIIETGTFHGTGTTKIIALSLKELGLNNTQFFSIEVNTNNHLKAIEYIKSRNLQDYVTLLNGLSLPHSLLPSVDEIEINTVKEIEFDDIFVDHKESDRAKLYYNETNFENVEDDILQKCLIAFNYKPDFVLLDSGGHIGNIEFNYVIERLDKECIIALDDINHIKHRKSFVQIQNDSRFKIIIASDEKFGFCIAKFTPGKQINYERNTNIHKMLFIRTDSIGDNLIAITTLNKIHEAYPKTKIDVVCQNHISELYESLPFINKIIAFDSVLFIEDAKYQEKIIWNLKSDKYDLLLNSIYSRTTISELFASNADAIEKIAIDGCSSNMPKEELQKNNDIYSHLITSNGYHKSELKRHTDFLKGLGLKGENTEPSISINQEDEIFAIEFVKKFNLKKETTIALFAGAQQNLRIYEHYGKAINNFCVENEFSVIVLGAASDKQANGRNFQDIKVPIYDLTGKTTIRQSAAIIRRCAVAVGAETGLAHLACAVEIPNVIVIGGGHFGRFMPYSKYTSLVVNPMDCFGCNWFCKFNNARCIKNVSSDLLGYALSETLLSQSSKPRLFVESVVKYEEENILNRFVNLEELDVYYINNSDYYKRTIKSGCNNFSDVDKLNYKVIPIYKRSLKV